MATKTKELVPIRPVEIERIEITIVGDSSLITHAWSEKAKKQMLDAQMGKAAGRKKSLKNPVEDFISSMFWLGDIYPAEPTEEAFYEAIEKGARFGFPVKAVKDAAISAAYRSGWTKDKVSVRGAFFVRGEYETHKTVGDGEFAQIITDEPPHMREDSVKVGMGTADLRYRGEFDNWRMNLEIEYNRSSKYDKEAIMTMINAGGFTVGIGEWRPDKSGDHGRFHVMAK